MKEYINFFDGLSTLLKVVFALPFLDIVWVIYRLIKSIESKNTVGIIVAVCLIVFGLPFLWILDIITLLINGTVLWFE